jgi:hypothetical protein
MNRISCCLCALLLGSTAGVYSQGITPSAVKEPPQKPGAPGPSSAGGFSVEVKKNGSRSTTLVGSTGGGNYFRSATMADAIPPLVIQFSSTNQTRVQEWEEDLTVMTRLLEESLQRAADEDLSDFKTVMGIPITTTTSRSVRPLYLEAFGALFMVKVNFPVVAPTKQDEEKPEKTESEWEKARQELFGKRQASWMGGNVEAGVDYDADQVDTLKKELIESLKNASNFRHLQPQEYVSITVYGSANSGAKVKTTRRSKKGPDAAGGPENVAKAKEEIDRLIRDQANGRVKAARAGTVLTMRVKKADVDAFAKGDINYETFEKKVDVNTYLGSGYGVTSLNSWIQSTIRQIGR